jgi:ethanolamine utilization protein EutN
VGLRERVHLGRVIGRLVASHRYEGLSGVPLQLIQPLDADGEEAGSALVACTVVSSGPGDTVHFIDGREAAMACPESFVPVDATILGIVEEATNNSRVVAGLHRRDR